MRHLLLLGFVTASGPALADPFPPVGLWRGESSGDYLVVMGEGFCATGGRVTLAGPCSWEAEAHSGTLSMRPTWTAGPKTYAVGVQWLSQNAILVNGSERFDRKG